MDLVPLTDGVVASVAFTPLREVMANLTSDEADVGVFWVAPMSEHARDETVIAGAAWGVRVGDALPLVASRSSRCALPLAATVSAQARGEKKHSSLASWRRVLHGRAVRGARAMR